jgi:hypothetical protein
MSFYCRSKSFGKVRWNLGPATAHATAFLWLAKATILSQDVHFELQLGSSPMYPGVNLEAWAIQRVVKEIFDEKWEVKKLVIVARGAHPSFFTELPIRRWLPDTSITAQRSALEVWSMPRLFYSDQPLSHVEENAIHTSIQQNQLKQLKQLSRQPLHLAPQVYY